MYPKPQGQNMSTEDMIQALTPNVSTMQQNMVQFQYENKSSIQNLENQMSQISSAVSRLEAKDSGKLPSQMEPNPRQQAHAVTLRSGKEPVIAKEKAKSHIDEEEDDELGACRERSTGGGTSNLNSTTGHS
ncbi:unnamed protein product [Cuscuta epithymum]|uniref:Uncharacterized protein n=1 Tax=Cuscuta epithymum TaxID=186058 RepID=A0AAV0DYX9_9ASTE|nr:unnamed protein product [Cuscuta epithymum]